ncbi:MAG: PIN domain-containing protein [Candidatus Paceibacteria bacterium]
MVILDTNIIIDHLRQQDSDNTALISAAKNKSKENLAISTITIQELYEGQSTGNSKEEEYLLATITPLKILPYSYEIAQKAGKIARDLTRTIELADAAIAATAIINGADLFTLNKKDFKKIENLELINF